MPDTPFKDVVAGLKASVRELRGSTKLRPALDAFGVDPSGRICLDVGASTGGFTTVLLERGASKVYAVDAGHGQLRGALRQDPRVVNLESTNVGTLTIEIVPEAIDLVTIDVSYLSLAEAVRQIEGLSLAIGCELVGLVKPMFELRLPEAPTDDASLSVASLRAASAMDEAGWTVVAMIPSSQRGAKGAIEGFIHAHRA